MCVYVRTDNCVVIVQGVLSLDGVFYAQQLGLPPAEAREDLAEASKVNTDTHTHTHTQVLS